MSDNNRNQQDQHQGQSGNREDVGSKAGDDKQSGPGQGSGLGTQGIKHTGSQSGSDLGKNLNQEQDSDSSDPQLEGY